MFEVRFNKEKNIKKDITANKKKKNINNKHTIIMSAILLYTIVGFLVGKYYNEFWILNSFPIVCFAGLTYNWIDTIVIYIKSEKGFKNTCNLVDELEKENIYTTASNLLNSVIIEKSKKTIKELQDDDNEKTYELEKTNDTYYLFLDNNSSIQGILERNINISNTDEESEDKQYFILEQEDICKLEDRVSKVKKLVKVKK